jgi:hypothetical protein
MAKQSKHGYKDMLMHQQDHKLLGTLYPQSMHHEPWVRQVQVDLLIPIMLFANSSCI